MIERQNFDETVEATASLDMSKLGEIKVSSPTNRTTQYALRMRTAPITYKGKQVIAYETPVSQQTDIAPLPPFEWKLRSYEEPAYGVNRVCNVVVPIPEWVRILSGGALAIEIELAVPSEEIADSYSAAPNSWKLQVDTGSLWSSVLPAATMVVPGTSLPTRWLISLAGLLASRVLRPKTFEVTLTWYTKQLTNLSVDFDLEYQCRADRLAILPGPRERLVPVVSWAEVRWPDEASSSSDEEELSGYSVLS